MKGRKGWIFLVLGIVVGIIAVVVQQQINTANNTLKPVVRVKEAIPAFQPVEKNQVEKVEIPVAAIPKNSITDPAQVIGKNLKSMLVPGTILQTDYLASKDGDGLAVALTEKKNPQYRTITLNGTPIVKNGYIKVGDRVDVLGAVKSNNDTTGVPLLSNIEVLALSGEQQQDKTITLVVTPEQALKLHTFKYGQGDFEFTLRPYQATDVPNTIIHMSDIVGKENAVPYESKKRVVEQP